MSMWVRDEIVEVLGDSADELSPTETRSVFDAITRQFGHPGRRALWERLRSSVGMRDAKGWKLVEKLAVGPVVFVVEDSQGECGFRFKSGAAVVGVLEQTSGYEFYVTDEMNTYLIAFNHHDYLIGSGAVEELMRSMGAT